MNNQRDWDLHYLREAELWAQRSKDPSSKVGAVLVNELGEVVGTGYNGFPRGVWDKPERYADRDTKLKMIVHAEVNAVVTAGHRARGATLYVWPTFAGAPNVCNECAKVVIQAGIKRIVGLDMEVDWDRVARWKESIEASRVMLFEAGVQFGLVKPYAD